MQNKINFIIEKCGGDSLSHVINGLNGTINRFYGGFGFIGGVLVKYTSYNGVEKTEELECWQLLIDNKEAKLQDQSVETINSLATILGYEEK